MPEEPENDRPGYRHRVTAIGKRLGGSLLGGSLYELPPGEKTWPYHYEVGCEERRIVVSGRPRLREPDGERELAPGEVDGLPPEGPAGAHQVINRSQEPSASCLSSKEPLALVHCPDSGKVSHCPLEAIGASVDLAWHRIGEKRVAGGHAKGTCRSCPGAENADQPGRARHPDQAGKDRGGGAAAPGDHPPPLRVVGERSSPILATPAGPSATRPRCSRGRGRSTERAREQAGQQRGRHLMAQIREETGAADAAYGRPEPVPARTWSV
jgi:uncharacterized cupin superfamily protein